MPVPTDTLDADIKGVRAEWKELRDEAHRIDRSLTEIKTQLGDAIKVASWGVTLFAGTLVAVPSGIEANIWWAATLSADVKNLAARVEPQKGQMIGIPKIEPAGPAK